MRNAAIVQLPVEKTALAARQYDLKALIRDRQYIVMDAADTLKTFMQENWPAKDLFFHALSPILETAGAGNRKVRAFGEMIMLLWKIVYMVQGSSWNNWGMICRNNLILRSCLPAL